MSDNWYAYIEHSREAQRKKFPLGMKSGQLVEKVTPLIWVLEKGVRSPGKRKKLKTPVATWSYEETSYLGNDSRSLSLGGEVERQIGDTLGLALKDKLRI